MLAIPKQPEELTAAWLSEALGVTVTAIEVEPIAAGVGFLGKLTRLTPRYAGAAAGAPRSVIAKLPTLDPGTRQLAKLFRFYEREVRFYQEIAERIVLRVPRAYHRAFDPATGNFVLLLEDMAPARIGDQLESCNVAQAHVAVREIAGLHAGWWQSPKLAELDWMPAANDPVHLAVAGIYQQCWPAFLQFAGSNLPEPVKRIGEALASRINRIQHIFTTDRPNTIVHGDFRLDNLFFASERGGVPFAAIDWQVTFRGCGTFDVAYMVAGNLKPAMRRELERELLQLYHERLLAGGVSGYDYATCWDDYRISVLFCLVYVVVSIGTLDPTNARGLALFHAWVERVGTAIMELEAEEVMPA
jgi:hypothetical protein